MPANKGKLKEDEFYLNLNNKKVGELLPNLRSILEDLFGALDANEVVKCEQPEVFIKPDFLITYKGVTKGLSMKTGESDVVHSEYISTFTDFLKSIGYDKNTIDIILLYHYGDDTLDGTGKIRFSGEVVGERYKKYIKKANIELNKDPEKIIKVIDRLVFDGVDPNAPKADLIYHGDIYQGVSLSRRQAHNYIYKKDWNKFDHLHIGPLLFFPHARYANKEIKSKFYREHIDAKWIRFKEDITYISTHFFNYIPLNKRK